MPETYIVYRHLFRYELNYTPVWREEFYNFLNDSERQEAKLIIEKNDFARLDEFTKNPKIIHFLRHYKIQRSQISNEDTNSECLRKQYDKLIKEDPFIDLTLTYDFEPETAPKKKSRKTKVAVA